MTHRLGARQCVVVLGCHLSKTDGRVKAEGMLVLAGDLKSNAFDCLAANLTTDTAQNVSSDATALGWRSVGGPVVLPKSTSKERGDE